MAVVALAAPQREADFIPIVRDSRSEIVDGNYNFEFETGDGLTRSEEGVSGPNGAVTKSGSFM